jgi:hypothetical protein
MPEHVVNVETEFRRGPIPAGLGLEQFFERDYLWMQFVLFAQCTEARFSEQARFCLDIHVRLEEPNVPFGNCGASEPLVNLRFPFLRWLLEHRDDGIIDSAPQTRASTHDRAHRREIGRAH